MAVRDILYFPNPVLTEPTKEVNPTSEETRALVQDLIDTMVAAQGLGLAAPQIGESKRVCVLHHGGEFHVLVNPQVQRVPGDKVSGEEGCLSFPGVTASVDRYSDIILSYDTPDGERVENALSGMGARVVQHEVDHLEGILFTERMSPLQKRLFMTKYRKEQKRQFR